MREGKKTDVCAAALSAMLACGGLMPSANATNNVISGSTNRTYAASSALASDYLFDTAVFALASSRAEDLVLFDSRFCTWDEFGLWKFSSYPPAGLAISIR